MVFGLFNSPVPFKGQKYAALKKTALASGNPFIDMEFQPNDKALFTSTASSKLTGIEWKRPKDICDDPKLFVDGASSHDVSQGSLGNCWFVAACSCLAQDKAIWTKVIPDHKEQEWDPEHPEKYAGIFRFDFWRFGQWVEVVVDDFLPVRGNKLVFVHSKSKNEFWSALLEKAYAKLIGCYEYLDGGELAEALEDFTGGIAEPIDLEANKYFEDDEKRDELYNVMKEEVDNRALMAAAIPAKSSEEMEQSIDVGLVKGHAYGITAVRRVALEGSGLFGLFNQDKLSMIRLRNPWGGTEWNGAFSDGSEEWNKIDKASREKIGLTFDDDGEFWMTFEDYCKYFKSMSICRVLNKSFFSLNKKWHEARMNVEWKSPGRAGGCINNKETFLHNPQFVFKVEDKDDEVLIGLTQKSARTDKDDTKDTIGFSVMKVEENRRYRSQRKQEIITSSSFKNSRAIFIRYKLAKGRYVVIPCTFDPGHTNSAVLRVFTSNDSSGRAMEEDKPSSGSALCCIPACRVPQLMTRIKVIRAVGLESQEIGGADPYCIIKCEGESVESTKVNDTLSPEWNVAAIFFRKDPVKKPVIVEIWNKNTIKDSFMGQHVFQDTAECDGKMLEVDLTARKDGDKKPPGKVYVEITQSRKLGSY